MTPLSPSAQKVQDALSRFGLRLEVVLTPAELIAITGGQVIQIH